MSDIRDQIRELSEIVEELSDRQEALIESHNEEVIPSLSLHRSKIEEMYDLFDLHFLVIARAKIEGCFDRSGVLDEDEYRSTLYHRLMDLQREYLAVMAVAEFLEYFGSS